MHHAGVPGHIHDKRRLHLAQGDFSVPLRISMSLNALHEVVAETAMRETGFGDRYVIVLTGRKDGKSLGK